MQAEANLFIPRPPEGRETQGSYWQRLEDAMIRITAFKRPPEMAIKALAFIVVEAPPDFDSGSTREVLPLRRIRNFLSGLPTDSRELFRAEAMRLGSYREAQINHLLKLP